MSGLLRTAVSSPRLGVVRGAHVIKARLSPAPIRALATGVAPRTKETKDALVEQLLAAKAQSGKTFTQIAAEVGLTNGQTAQLFYNQAQLKPETVEKLRKAVPALTDEHLAVMCAAPLRRFDPDLIQEPLVYRLYEAVMHYGESLKALTNEEFGDGIMSAIDFYCDVEKIKGVGGEERVVITFNGKFLPHIEQRAENNTAKK